MMPESRLAVLHAIRLQVEALIAEESAAQPVVEFDTSVCPQCGAREDKVVDASTLDGTKRNRCTNCGHEWLRFPAKDKA